MTVSLTIDGVQVQADEGESLLAVVRKAGAAVPSLCNHPLLRPYGACRLCLVEVTKGGRTKTTTSCNYEVQEGISVRTDTEEIKRHRRMVLQLLLAMAPEAEAVKGLARANGVTEPRFGKSDPEAERPGCILCGLCARVCEEVVGACALTLSGRGDRRSLEVPYKERSAESCIGCGACAAVCPTGAVEIEHIKVEVLRKRPATDRKCRYNMMGMMPGALCPNNYDCAVCEVDQRFVESCKPHHPVFVAKGLVKPKSWED